MGLTAGIDFGTTNSALAVSQLGGTRSVNICNYGSKESTLRSTLFIEEDHRVRVGQDAIQEYIVAGGHAGRFMQSLKAFLPSSSFTEARVYGRLYTIERLVSLILAEIKRIGESALNQPLDDVVLGRPVYFSEQEENDKLAQARLEEAARQAGFKSIRFELEPVAAALAYQEQMSVEAEQTIFMGDFGGGTSDFTVMNLGSGTSSSLTQKRRQVLAIDGVYIGGDTFDGRLMLERVAPYFGRHLKYKSLSGESLDMPNYIMQALGKWHELPFLRTRQMLQSLREIRRTADHPEMIDNLEFLIWENTGFAVFQEIEKAKKTLSAEEVTTISYRDHQVTIEEIVSRRDFETIIANDVEQIEECITRCVKTAGITEGQIDKVLLTGGSSRIPVIRKIFESRFGPEKIVPLDAFTSVAQGLASVGN